MKVYIVLKGLDYEGMGVDGVFSSQKRVLKFIRDTYPDFVYHNEMNEWRKREWTTDFIHVEIWEINGEYIKVI